MATRTYLKNIKEGFERDTIRALRDLGIAAMNHAYAKKRFTNRTGNLHDSYASAVFINGSIVQSTLRYLDSPISRKVDPKTGKNGHQTAKDFMSTGRFGREDGEIVLVVIAAMYYAGILEKYYHYEVISPANDYIESHWQETMTPVYSKYGIKGRPKAKIINGERL